MFEKTLYDPTRKLLSFFRPENLPQNSYLAGGTAIALQLGHRKSVDLDFFTPTEFMEDQWQQTLEKDFNFKLRQKDKQTLSGNIGRVKFSLFGYRYPLILPKEHYGEIWLASLPDLSAMKLATLLGRETKRDLIDIYFLAQKYGLSKLFEFYNQKFGNLEEMEISLKKGLIFFDEADKEDMPDMLVPADWKKIKSWFIKQVKEM